MAKAYHSDEALLRDYNRLPQEYQGKADKYIKDLLKLYRAETGVRTKVYGFGMPVREEAPTPKPPIRCSFCGKSQDDVERLVAAPHDIFICNECIRLCCDILDEAENEDAGEKDKYGEEKT